MSQKKKNISLLTIDNLLLCVIKRKHQKQKNQCNPCHLGWVSLGLTALFAPKSRFLGFL